MTTIHSPWLRIYLWGNLHLALGTFVCVWATRSGLAGHPVAPGVVESVVALGVAAVYGIDRLLGAKSATGPRGDWFHRHRTAMWIGSLTAGLAGGLLALFLPWVEMRWLLVGGICGAAYGLEVVPWRGRWHRPGAFLWTRPWLVAVAWMLGTATAPLAECGMDLTAPDALRWQLGRFLLISAMVIPFDIRDCRVDARQGVATLATVLGPRKAFWISRALAICALTVAVWPPAQPEAVAAGLGAVIVLALTHIRRGALWRLLLVDGLLFVPALGVAWRLGR